MSPNTRLSEQPVMLLMTGGDAKWGRGHSSGSRYDIQCVKQASRFTHYSNKLFKNNDILSIIKVITVFCGKVAIVCAESNSGDSYFGVGTIRIRLYHRDLDWQWNDLI